MAVKAKARDHLREAYERAGKQMRAGAVATCGMAAVGYFAPQQVVPLAGRASLVLEGPGQMLRSAAGVPTAIAPRCGSPLCVDCARSMASRRRRVIVQRLEELQARTSLIGPLFRRHVGDAPTTKETLDAIANEATEAARAARAARWDQDPSTRGLGAEQLEDAGCWERGEDDGEAFDVTPAHPAPLPTRTAIVRRLRSPRRPPRHDRRVYACEDPADAWRSVGVVDNATPRRRTRESFRIAPPTERLAYGCRQVTLTQPARPLSVEGLEGGIERITDALARFTRSHVWKAHADAAVIRIEFELSTPEKREDAASLLEQTGDIEGAERMRASDEEWWHVHAHVLLWGLHWSAIPSTMCHERKGCVCTGCTGSDDEDALLMVWRRALVETGRYGAELRETKIREGELLRALRQHTHPSRRTWAVPLEGVRLGGARIQSPSRTVHGEKLTPWGAICECVKYTTKPMALAAMSIDRVVEILRATHGRRLMRCTGLLYGLHLVEDDSEAKPEAEGLDQETGIGLHAYTPDGHVVHHDDISWRFDDESAEERRAAWEALHDLHENQRRERATGPPQQEHVQ